MERKSRRMAQRALLALIVSLAGAGIARGVDELAPSTLAHPVGVDGRVLFAVVAPTGTSAAARASRVPPGAPPSSPCCWPGCWCSTRGSTAA
jgi:hypothetical protein